jgi:hypothetical protein
MKNSEIGTFLDGIAATSDLDTSGERIDIKGIDISSLPIDGLLNFEHKNDTGSQIIGKIVEAKKIMKESDCTNERHKHFWELSRKKPFLYIIAVLFNKVGHSSASDVAAMLNFDKKIDTGETRGTGWFSIEGSRLGKEGSNITKCIARKIAFTNLPCNRSCVAELLEDPDKYCKQISKKKVQESMKKSLQEETNLIKAEPRKYFKELAEKKPSKSSSYSKITTATGEHREGKPFKPEREHVSRKVPPDWKIGDRTLHDKKQPKAGKAFYRDLYKDLENPIRKAIMKKDIKKAKVDIGSSIPEKQAQRSLRNEVEFESKDGKWERKGTPKGQKGVHPEHSSAVDQGVSTAGEHSRSATSAKKKGMWNAQTSAKDSAKRHIKQVSREQKQIKPNLPKSEESCKPSKKEILKSLASEAWDNFKHKDLLIESIKKTEPELEDNEILGIAKTYAYIDMKKKESEIEDMFEKDEDEDLNKAKVDEGKSPAMKQVARAYRNKRLKTKKPDGSYKITGKPKDIQKSKDGRCWDGYEPTPGKKPYDKGSCQPVKKEEKPFHGYNKKKHSKEGGLNDKERERINREEGSNLKRPVTGKVKAGSDAAKRKKSFCSRMSGNKGPTSKDGKLTPKGAALKRWNCNKNEEND